MSSEQRKKEPKTHELGELDTEYKETVSKEPFLLKRIAQDDVEILIYSTRKNIMLLCNSNYWIMDGTFKIIPNIFYQLFTIHCNVRSNENCIFPMVDCLMSGKSTNHYELLSQGLLDLIDQFGFTINTKMAICDYEKAIATALENTTAQVQPTGCYFHLNQAIVAKIRNLGHKKL